MNTRLAICLWLLFPIIGHAQRLANPQASETARAVYYNLSHYKELPGNCLILGQNLGHGSECLQSFDPLIEALGIETGFKPTLLGIDFGMDPTNFYPAVSPLLLEYSEEGGLITASCHFTNPWTGGDSNDPPHPGGLQQLLVPGAPGHDAWFAQLESVALGLKELKNRNVPVLWRPLHKMNASWFWWGKHNQENANAYKALWRHMFDYFTYVHGLDNLIWVYSAEESYEAPVDYYYPGNNFVDMVGLSIFNADVQLVFPEDYPRILALDKPFCITEFGPKIESAVGVYNYSTFLDKVVTKYPKAVYVMAWHDYDEFVNSFIRNREYIPLMQNPCIVQQNEFNWQTIVVDSEEEINPTFQLSPNPVDSELSISIPDHLQGTTFHVSDGTGKIILKGQLPFENRFDCSIQNYPSGIYQFVIWHQHQPLSSTFVKL